MDGDFIHGLQILMKYNPKGDRDFSISAEHDMIYYGDTDWDITEEDLKRIDELGWDIDTDIERFTYMV